MRPRGPSPLAFAVGAVAVAVALAGAGLGGCGDSMIDDSPPSPAYTLVGTTTDINVCNTGGAATLFRCAAPVTTSPRLALGVCGDLVVNAPLTLDQAGSDVQVSGTTTSSAPLSVDGSFVGMGSVVATNTETFGGSFSTAGDWTVSAAATVAGDVNVGGMLNASSAGAVTVTGTETVPATDVTLDLDCASAPDLSTLITTAATPAQLEASADAGLPSNSLVNVDAATDLTLGCGQYTLDSIGVNAPLTLHVQGTTTLVVTGNVNVAAPLIVDVRKGAIFDLAIGGALAIENTVTLSDAPDATDASGIWLGVAGPLTIGSPMTMAGTLVTSGLTTANDTLDLTGSALVAGLQVASPVNLHLTTAAPAISATGCVIAPQIDAQMSRRP
jgi:hypothetical protein